MTTQPSEDRAGQVPVDVVLAGVPAMKRIKHKVLKTLDKAENVVHRAVKRYTGSRSRVDRVAGQAEDAATDVATAEAERAEKVWHGHSDGHWFPNWIARLIAALAVIGLWFVDRSLLLVLNLSLFATSALTLVVVAGSAATAYIAGVVVKRRDTASHPKLNQSLAEAGVGNIAIVLGVTIEIVLGIVRTVVAHALFSSALLVAAGLGLWGLIGFATYMAHDGIESRIKRAKRNYNRLMARVGRLRELLAKDGGRVASAQAAYIHLAQDATADVRALVAAAVTAFERAHPGIEVVSGSEVTWLIEIDEIAHRILPKCCQTPDESVYDRKPRALPGPSAA